MSTREHKEFMKAQLTKILQDYETAQSAQTADQFAVEWVMKNAKAFRDSWSSNVDTTVVAA